jgi:hypothetical protein
MAFRLSQNTVTIDGSTNLIINKSPVNGYVLKSDDLGNVSWVSPATLGGGGGGTGTAGTSGTEGTSGTSGANGSSGSAGTSGISGTSGTSGQTGTSGKSGTAGTSGYGLPPGGAAGQVLGKVSSTNYDTQWVNSVGPGGDIPLAYEGRAVYVDATYGNNSTGLRNRLDRPFLTWQAAVAASEDGDVIVFNAGTYTIDLQLWSTPYASTGGKRSDRDIHCKPGVYMNGTTITACNSIGTKEKPWRLTGHAQIVGIAMAIGNPSNNLNQYGEWYIDMELDALPGGQHLLSSGPLGTFSTSQSPIVDVKIKVAKFVKAQRPIRIHYGTMNATVGGVAGTFPGAKYNIVVDVKEKIQGTDLVCVQMVNPYFSAGRSPAYGQMVINTPILESTSANTSRSVILSNMNPPDSWDSNVSNPDAFRLIVNAGVIRHTTTSFTEQGLNNLVSVIWFDGGDNYIINADIDGGVGPCIINRSGGGAGNWHTGSLTITGNIYSDREIVQQYVKFANGNGWNNIIFKDCYIWSKGLGASGALFHRSSSYSNAIGGYPGNIQLVNCVLYNQNVNGSANAVILKDDLPEKWGKINNMQAFNCIGFVENAGFFASSTEVYKPMQLHSVRSNRPLGGGVQNSLASGFISDPNLTIPKARL